MTFALKTRLFAAGAVALALAGCNDKAPATADAAAPLAVLDASATLPYAPPAQVQRYEPEEGYRWAERAYGVQRAVYDTPPDYGFDYGDEEPLAWETVDDWSVYAEPWDDGYRYYYYEPGSDYPYFVRDDDYGYGYNRGGVLVVVVDARGRYLPVEDFRRVAPLAGRYYAHGRDLRSAGQRARRIQIDDRAWAAQAPRVSRSTDRWLTAARGDSDWRRWREADRGRELDRFAAEQLRRAEVQRARGDREARDGQRRDFDARRGQQAQAQAAEQAAREAAAREADARRQSQRVEAERRQSAQAQGERHDRDQRAEQVRAQQREAGRIERQQGDARKAQQAQQAQRAQQAQAERQRRDQQAQQARERQAQAGQLERQRRDAEKAKQVRARGVEQQARAAEQAARVAAAREQAGKPAKAAEPPRAGDPGKPRGNPDNKGRGPDKDHGRGPDKRD